MIRWRLLRAFLTERPSHFLLAVVLAALGLASAASVLWLRDTLIEHASRQSEGIDLVVGAKGSALQNVLAAVYHVDVPNGNISLADVEAIRARPDVEYAIPIALGDSVAGARIVGSDAGFLQLYRARAAVGSDRLEPMQAVLGAEVARRTGLRLGDVFVGVHGLGETSEAHDAHPYTVTGVLAPTGRVIDHLVVTALESVWIVHAEHTAATEPEATFALIKVRSPVAMATLPRALNALPGLQAAVPALESARLLAVFGWVVVLVQAFAWLLVGAALASLLGALMQAVARREPDLALLRSVGASTRQLAMLLAVETGMIVVAAILLAAAGLAVVPFAAAWLTGVALPWRWGGGVCWLAWLAAATLVAALVAMLPALWRAARIDVVEQLSERR